MAYTQEQLERMVYSKTYFHRAEAAWHGVGLDILINDPHWLVRATVAR